MINKLLHVTLTPFIVGASADRRLFKIPTAFFSSSKYPISCLIMVAKACFLNLIVNLSPDKAKHAVWIRMAAPAPTPTSTMYIEYLSISAFCTSRSGSESFCNINDASVEVVSTLLESLYPIDILNQQQVRKS